MKDLFSYMIVGLWIVVISGCFFYIARNVSKRDCLELSPQFEIK